MKLNPDYQILLYYKYVDINDPEQIRVEQKQLCEQLNLKGRIIVATEGINGTVEGTVEATENYITTMQQADRFRDIHFKRSTGTGKAFPRLSVKVRTEIVSSHLGEDFPSPRKLTGNYLAPHELHSWFNQGKKFYIVDMRNDYEFKVGHFENSILPQLANFRDLPKVLSEIQHLKHETIVTVCTGGVRCEKASGFLLNNGFNDVYQLEGGIVSYMEKYPNQNFLGKLYVFDGRVVMGFNTDSPEHKVIANCSSCDQQSDNYIDCHYLHCRGNRHFICCEDCMQDEQNLYCSEDCFRLANPKTTLPIMADHAKMISS